MLSVDPIIPIALWFPLLVAVVAALVVYAVLLRRRVSSGRRYGILSMMALAAALPMLILLNPTWIKPLPPPAGKPLLTLLVDRSASMATSDAGESRYDKAVKMATRAANDLSKEFEVCVRVFDDALEPADLQSLDQQTLDAEATDLAAAIEGSLEDRPQGQAILLLSDGAHNTAGGASQVRRSVELARAMAAPIYTHTIGEDANVKDLAVSLDLPQEMAFAGQTLPVTVTIEQRGALTDTATLKLLLDDQEVQSQEVSLRPNGVTKTTLDVKQSKSGLFRYEVQLIGPKGEVTGLNNNATLLVRVVNEPVQVLVLEGKPYWDSKFLLRMLASDQAIELTSLVKLTPERFVLRRVARPRVGATAGSEAPDNASEASREESWKIANSVDEMLNDPDWLSKFQVVVLGRDAEAFLDDSRVERVKRWLAERGGALVCMRGAPASLLSQRLGSLMPVRWSPSREKRFRVKLTDSGESMSWLAAGEGADSLAGLPSLATVARPERPKPLAVVLASSAAGGENPEPVITYQPVGSGRVVVVEGAGMWRWAFLPVDHQQHDEVYGRLWRSLVRWLVSGAGLLPSEQHALRSDKVTYSPDERATATLLLREAQTTTAPTVELISDALPAPQQFTPTAVGDSPGQYRVVFGELPEGRYRARIAGGGQGGASSVAAFDVRGNLTERLNIAARPDMMKMIADSSGGAVIQGELDSDFGKNVRERIAENFPLRVRRIAAWDRWWVLVGVLAAWAVNWGLRRQTGLI